MTLAMFLSLVAKDGLHYRPPLWKQISKNDPLFLASECGMKPLFQRAFHMLNTREVQAARRGDWLPQGPDHTLSEKGSR